MHCLELVLTGSDIQLAFVRDMVEFNLRAVLPAKATVGGGIRGMTLTGTDTNLLRPGRVRHRESADTCGVSCIAMCCHGQ